MLPFQLDQKHRFQVHFQVYSYDRRELRSSISIWFLTNVVQYQVTQLRYCEWSLLTLIRVGVGVFVAASIVDTVGRRPELRGSASGILMPLMPTPPCLGYGCCYTVGWLIG
jgi:hypothetical protein